MQHFIYQFIHKKLFHASVTSHRMTVREQSGTIYNSLMFFVIYRVRVSLDWAI